MVSAKGAEVVKKLETWFSSYMAMPREYALVVALWVLNTHVFQAFDAVPYVVCCASTKQSGKTVLTELAALVSKNGKVITDVTKATLFRMLEARDGIMTICIDEFEKQSREGSELRPFANAGYRRGQSIPRTMPNGKVVDFPVFCPKWFAQIGDVYDTLRDRSIVLWLSRGIPARKYRRSEAEREAIALNQEIAQLFRLMAGNEIKYVEATWLEGRDEEIWSPLFSLAHAFDLSKEDRDRLVAASADLTAAKTQKARTFENLGTCEGTAQEDQYAVRVLRDLVSVLREDEKAIPSDVAVERLKSIPSGPWRHYKGGLNEIGLAAMLARYQALAEYPKVVFISKKTKPHHLRGYHTAALRKALRDNMTGAVIEAQAVQS